jgi:predicted  nucleic acid-binding Zn-ribbon protein
MPLNELEFALESLKNELERVKPASDQLETAGRGIADLVVQTHAEQEKLDNLGRRMLDVGEKMEKVDFPSRLDKLDSTVSGINIGIQNMQAGLRASEERIEKRFSTEITKLAETVASEARKGRRTLVVMSISLIGFVLTLCTGIILMRLKAI